MHCPYCGTDDGTPERVMDTHFTRLDCKFCGAEIVMEITVQKLPDEAKLPKPWPTPAGKIMDTERGNL